MTEPTTNARRVLLARWYDPKLDKDAAIAAIEAEKEAEVRARLAEEVAAVSLMQGDYVIHAMNGTTRTPVTPADWVEAYRAAVLALIQPEGAKA